jgi:hypothetical protein
MFGGLKSAFNIKKSRLKKKVQVKKLKALLKA